MINDIKTSPRNHNIFVSSIVERQEELERLIEELEEVDEDLSPLTEEQTVELKELKDELEEIEALFDYEVNKESQYLYTEDGIKELIIEEFQFSDVIPREYASYFAFNQYAEDQLSDFTTVEVNGDTYYIY